MLFKFLAKIVERHYSSKLPCVYFEFPAQIITVIIPLYQLLLERHPAVERLFIWISRCNYNRHYYSMSAVSRASLNCRSSVSHLSSAAESLPKTAYYFLFSFSSSWSMSEKHVWKSHWRLSPCRRLFQAESWVVSFKWMLILGFIECPSILSY